MRRGGSTTITTTARRCLGRLALLAVATATPVDYAADHVVFAHLRTGEGNRAFRDAFRETTAADAVPGFGYAFFADQTGCCQEDALQQGSAGGVLSRG